MYSLSFIVALTGFLAVTYAYTTPTNCMISGCGMGGKCASTTPERSECICYQGFQKSNITFKCEDYNECAETSMALCPNGECYNMPGTYTCNCYNGFRPGPPDGKVCVPIGGLGNMNGNQGGMFPNFNQLLRCQMLRQIWEM